MIILTKMNWCVHRCRHEQSPYQWIHIEVEHFVFRLTTNFLSQVWEDFLKLFDNWTISGYPNIVWQIVWPFFVGDSLSRFCRYWFPRTSVRIYMCLPHLRTRCGISFWVFRRRFPFTGEKKQLLTLCFEYPQAVKCTRTRYCWRPIDRLWHQVHPRLRLSRYPSFSGFSCNSFEIAERQLTDVSAAYEAAIANREDCSTHHVWNFLSSECLQVGVWCQRIWSGFGMGPNWTCQTTNRVRLCACGTHVSSIDFFFWWSSWLLLRSSQKFEHSIRMTRSWVCEHVIDIDQSELSHLFWLLLRLLICFLDCCSHFKFPRAGFNTCMTKSHRSGVGIPCLRKTCIKRNSIRFRGTVWNRSLPLAHPTHREKCVTTKHSQHSTWSRFWIFKISCKVVFVMLSQSAPLCSIPPHDKIEYNHSCCGFMTSNEPSVCHKLLSILWLLTQVCSRTKEYEVHRCEPNIDTLQQLVSILLTTVPQSPIPLPWIASHQGMV